MYLFKSKSRNLLREVFLAAAHFSVLLLFSNLLFYCYPPCYRWFLLPDSTSLHDWRRLLTAESCRKRSIHTFPSCLLRSGHIQSDSETRPFSREVGTGMNVGPNADHVARDVKLEHYLGHLYETYLRSFIIQVRWNFFRT